MSDLKIGATLPTLVVSGNGRVADLPAAARHLEDLGLESVWVPDLIIGDGSPSLEATIALAAAAAVTERVQVGFSVLVLPMRPVALTAAQIMALQHVSAGRLLLGVGIGVSSGTPFWRAVGGPAQGRGRRTDAALEVLPQLVAGTSTRLEDQPEQPVVTLAPAAEMPPVLVGGFRNSEAGLRRAATYGDGWFPSLLTPQMVAASVVKLEELAAERGRATPSVTLGTHAILGDDDATRSAREALVQDMVQTHGIPREEAAMIPVTGDPQRAAERFAEYAAAGADRLVIAPNDLDWMRQSELIAETYHLLGSRAA